LVQGAGGLDFHAGDQGCFGEGRLWDDRSGQAGSAGGQQRRQDASDGA